jgi:hypothetical protein
MELSRATLQLVRDEAYVALCRDAVQESLKNLQRDKVGLVNSRPPFGVLAPKKTRDAFESSLRTTDDTETALRSRLTRIEKYETWLNRRLSRELGTYLGAASPEYKRVGEIKQLLKDWENGVTRLLPDTLIAFAREMRGLRLAVSTPNRIERPAAHEVTLLYEIAMRVESQLDRLAQIAAVVNAQALDIALEVRLAPLPMFRRSAWVDWLCAVPLNEALIDLARAEGEIRTFLNDMQPIYGRLQAGRVSCVQRQENYLQQYWTQLRAHAQSHWVEERDVDDVLNTLGSRYDADITRRQREVTYNPFNDGERT